MKLSAVSSLSAAASMKALTTRFLYKGQLPEEKEDGRTPNYLVPATASSRVAGPIIL